MKADKTQTTSNDQDGDPSSTIDPIKRPSPQLSFPLNYLSVVWRFLVLLACLPFDAILYSVRPGKRPRQSWTLLDTVFLNAVRRYLALIDKAGFKISTRDIDSEPGKLRNFMSGLSFEWVEGTIEEDLITGEIDDPWMKMKERVGVFSWYRKDRRSGTETEKNLDIAKSEGELVGIFFHGGAFTHNSAHPKSQSTVMPQTLFNREKRFVSMHSVEFRLLPDSPYPAALQDAVAVYIALLKRGVSGHNIVLVGDSSGANLALALARWVLDTRKGGKNIERIAKFEGVERKWKLEDPGGLILFSPWVDPSHSFLNVRPEDYIRRSNSMDYILEEGRFRHHLVSNLLGRHPHNLVLSPYLSPGRIGLPAGSFVGFPPTFISYGTAERGQAEDERLIDYLLKDGVHVEVVCTEDTPHDVLLLGFWKREQREEIWKGALKFLEGIPKEGDRTRSQV